MEKQESDVGPIFFQYSQFLGCPQVFPPDKPGKISAAVKFIIPGLKVGKRDKDKLVLLAHKCGEYLYDVEVQHATNKRTNEPATLITFAYYVDFVSMTVAHDHAIMYSGRLLIQRFLELLSFLFGVKIAGVHPNFTTFDKEKLQFNTIRTPIPPKSSAKRELKFSPEFEAIIPNDEIFSALFWLRRGLSEKDPIETFSALMVSLQIMARALCSGTTVKKCSECGAVYYAGEKSVNSLMKELIVDKLGASPDLFHKLWDESRNAVVAHGNRSVTPETFVQLTELKFDAANLAYQAIARGLGIPTTSLSPNPEFFLTDAYLYVD